MPERHTVRTLFPTQGVHSGHTGLNHFYWGAQHGPEAAWAHSVQLVRMYLKSPLHNVMQHMVSCSYFIITMKIIMCIFQYYSFLERYLCIESSLDWAEITVDGGSTGSSCPGETLKPRLRDCRKGSQTGWRNTGLWIGNILSWNKSMMISSWLSSLRVLSWSSWASWLEAAPDIFRSVLPNSRGTSKPIT